jgi:hypothetical protein
MPFLTAFLPVLLVGFVFFYMFWGGKSSYAMRELFYGYYYAEDGVISDKDKPDSATAFNKCIEKHIGIKVKVILSSDGKPMVYSSDKVKTSSNTEVLISKTDSEELADYGVMDLTSFLSLVDGKVPVIVEIVTGAKNDLACRRTADAIVAAGHKNIAVVSFHHGIVGWFMANEKEIFRGIVSAPTKDFIALPKMQRFFTGNLANNSICRPQMILYRNKPMPPLAKMAYGLGPLRGVWTLTDPDKAKELERDRSVIIFRGFEPQNPHFGKMPPRVKPIEEIMAERASAKQSGRKSPQNGKNEEDKDADGDYREFQSESEGTKINSENEEKTPPGSQDS